MEFDGVKQSEQKDAPPYFFSYRHVPRLYVFKSPLTPECFSRKLKVCLFKMLMQDARRSRL